MSMTNEIQMEISEIQKRRGRPKLSDSHKKCVRREYLNSKKQKKIEEGTYKPRGRPKKISV